MIFTAEHLTRDCTLDVDLCVIGSGAGGAPVAERAAKAGKRVVVLEAGGFVRPKDCVQLEHEMFPKLFHDKGGRATADKAIHVHQGKGVGGSTLHNLNLCARLPKAVSEQWAARVGKTPLTDVAQLTALYTRAEKRLSVSTVTAEKLNANNRVFKRGVERLKYRGGFMRHNRVGCVGSGFCELGCPFDGKQNALKVFITSAVESKATVLADTWAVRLELSGRRVSRVHAVVRDSANGKSLARVTISAKVVCVSASATGTPTLLQRSGVPDPMNYVGSQLHLHPAGVVAGVFTENLDSWSGVPQSYQCTQFLDFSEKSRQRVWIVPAFAHPVGVASILPEFGERHGTLIKHYRNLAAVTAMVHDETAGRVTPDGDFGVKMDYWLNRSDREQLRLGLRESARIMLAAGAVKALVPLDRTLEVANTGKLEATFSALKIERQSLNITAVHPMSSVWMGEHPATSCVAPSGRYHHLDNLFISDTSLFPSSIGVPPQLTTYAMGLHVGDHVLAAL